jgi:hypothetical protein
MNKPTNLNWNMASLTPAANEIFTSLFYQEPSRSGMRYVYWAPLDNRRVAISSNPKRPELTKTVTSELATSILAPTRFLIKEDVLPDLELLSTTSHAIRLHTST